MMRMALVAAMTVALALHSSWAAHPAGAGLADAALLAAPEVVGPPVGWLPDDPADSLWRAGREALNRGDFARAAALFGELRDRYANSGYAADAFYWEAFALYRTETAQALSQALALLTLQQVRFPDARTRAEADALATRIRGLLARRGDGAQAESLVVAAGRQRDECPDDDDDMRVAAINALQQMDADRAMPILKKVLARRDACSARLRKRAVWMAANNGTAESADVLLGVIRGDPDREVRLEAIFWLGQVEGERTVNVLDSLLRASDDESVQEKALHALSQHDSPRARQALHRLAEEARTPAAMRRRAIFAIGHFSGGREDAEFLRGLYARITDEEAKEQIIQSVAQTEGNETERWLLALATNGREPLELRKKALFWAGQGEVPIASIVELWPRLTEVEMKEQLIFVLSQRDERAATDRLIEIARSDPNRELRKKAIFWLGQKDDPRVQQFLLELIGQ
ncbi:MAG TPA: HEAT repeat domain-containing protein [Gemmatimonadaceae bacterium]|nr:HEAT repeat domain-containing protein [Gemmatimonadaceae bacterium]